MTDAVLKDILREYLGDSLKRNGQILYSGIDTLIPGGDFYFLGFNPADDGTNPPLCEVPLDRKDWSAYTQQCWYCPYPAGCAPSCDKPGKATHQKRVAQMMVELDARPEKTFATNLIFVQSHTVAEIWKDRLVRDCCWRVHEKMLAEVRPKFIICLGYREQRSAYSVVRQKAHDCKVEPPHAHFKSFSATFRFNDAPDLTTTVIGVRHPSWWPTDTTELRPFIDALRTPGRGGNPRFQSKIENL